MRLNVRCCCQPTKVFGTMLVPDRVANGGKFIAPEKPRAIMVADPNATIKTHLIEVKTIWVHGDRQTAVYSDDRPIEFWRNIPGFIEGDQV